MEGSPLRARNWCARAQGKVCGQAQVRTAQPGTDLSTCSPQVYLQLFAIYSSTTQPMLSVLLKLAAVVRMSLLAASSCDNTPSFDFVQPTKLLVTDLLHPVKTHTPPLNTTNSLSPQPVNTSPSQRVIQSPSQSRAPARTASSYSCVKHTPPVPVPPRLPCLHRPHTLSGPFCSPSCPLRSFDAEPSPLQR